MARRVDRQTKIEMGQRITALREAREWYPAEAARKIGISKQSLSGYELGKHMPEEPTLEKIARAYETSAQFIREGTKGLFEPTQDQSPRSGGAARVLQTTGTDWAMPSRVIEFTLNTTEKALRALRITTDDFSPEIERGDYVFVDTSCSNPAKDGIYVTMCEKTGQLSLSRLTARTTNELPIYGKVVGHFRAI